MIAQIDWYKSCLHYLYNFINNKSIRMVFYKLKDLEKEQSIIFNQMQQRINLYEDQQRSEKYQFTITKKQSNWLTDDFVNLVLKHTHNANGDELYIFYEKTIEYDNNLKLIPCNSPSKLIRLEQIKLAARNGHLIKIVYMIDKDKWEELNFKFKNVRIAELWEALIRNKKEFAKNSMFQKSICLEKLKMAEIKIKTLQEQLNKQRTQKDDILTNLNRITIDYNQYKEHTTDIEQRYITLHQRNIQLQKQIQRLKTFEAGELAKKEFQQLRDSCNAYQYELSLQKIKTYDLQRTKIEAEEKSHQVQTNLTRQNLNYQKQILQLKTENLSLKAGKQMQERFNKELVQKILQKNKLLRQINKELSNRVDLTASFQHDNVQDYRMHCGHLQNRNSRNNQ